MTRAEHAGQVMARMAANWPHRPLPDAAAAKMYADLKHLPVGQVLAGVETLYNDGREFPPNGAQIKAKVIELAFDMPAWADVKAELARPLEVNHAQPDTCPAGECDGSGVVEIEATNSAKPCACRAQRARPRHPLIVGFLETVGRDEFRDVLDDRTAEAQVRVKWEAFVRSRQRDEAYAGLPDAGLPMLERVNREPRQLGAALAGTIGTCLPRGQA